MTMTVTKDNVGKVLASIQRLVGQEVLVGIPATTTERSEGEPGQPINNAQLGYIHEYGSPKANIPARPFLEPGVEDQRESIGNHLQKAASSALKGDDGKLDAELNAAGLIAQAGARNRITSSNYEPLSPSTIRNRRKNRNTQSMRVEEQKYLDMVANGASPAQAQADAGIQPLINTGQLRNSITYVIRKKE
ncbi:hypothetical protein N5D52_14725 [Pseudomonas sp. GD03860]|uniref:hypothetical protein n=1 Tax=Pseudomonas sp. GD03860 TaxID=2975389 RepID=UPI0024479EEA|nr:hypothetical protein [Pseudomonas sp. GD03860]MDH0638199.1 hypothetical protein [Pseudomonas sp. GD03860]